MQWLESAATGPSRVGLGRRWLAYKLRFEPRMTTPALVDRRANVKVTQNIRSALANFSLWSDDSITADIITEQNPASYNLDPSER